METDANKEVLDMDVSSQTLLFQLKMFFIANQGLLLLLRHHTVAIKLLLHLPLQVLLLALLKALL